MNKDPFNQSFDQIDVPLEKLIAREKQAMKQAKKKERSIRRTKYSLFIACSIFGMIFASGFVSSGMAEALSNVPVIGSIYKEFRDIASEKIEKDHLQTVIEKQDQDNGITMTVKEAVYDGGRLIVTVVYSSDNKISLKEETMGVHYVTINGQPLDDVSGSSGQDEINDYTIIEHNQFIFPTLDQYGDTIKVGVHGEDLFGQTGKWEVEFPVEKVKGEWLTFNPGVTVETSDHTYAITAEQVTFSPLSTHIDLSIDYPQAMDENDSWPWFDFTVTDDKGRVYRGVQLEQNMVGKNGHHIILSLPPMDDVPTSFTLVPADTNRQGMKEEIKELQFTIPLKN